MAAQHIRDAYHIEVAVLHPDTIMRWKGRQAIRATGGLTEEGKSYYRYVVQLRRCGWRGPAVRRRADD